MPRVKSDGERGYIGVWMRRERTARGWSPERVVDELAVGGVRIRVDYYRGVEAGKKPGPELLEALTALYGSEPAPPPHEDDENGRVVAINALIAAVTAQTAAMQEIAAELREQRETSQGQAEGLAAALGALTETIESLRPALAGRSR